MLNDQENGGDEYFLNVFKDNFNGSTDSKCSYMIMISDKDKNIIIDVDGAVCNVDFGNNPDADVICRLSKENFEKVASGKMTFHRAFMTGDMSAKGNLKTLRLLDDLFMFA